MPNIAKLLKEEMSRLSRKEAKALAGPVQKQGVLLKRAVAGLKKRLISLERTTKELQSALAKVEGVQPVEAADPGKARITAKGVRSLRRKLRLSQSEFGKLIGITNVAVSHWEQQEGPLKVRNATRAALLAVRGIGAREAKRQLAERSVSAAPARRRQGGRRR